MSKAQSTEYTEQDNTWAARNLSVHALNDMHLAQYEGVTLPISGDAIATMPRVFRQFSAEGVLAPAPVFHFPHHFGMGAL